MERIAAELAAEYPDTNTNHGISFAPLHERMVRNIRPALLVLAWAVVLVLLIACVNVANLLLARGTGRTQEMAVRSALGAGRWQVVRQLLAESVLLGLFGGVLGLAVAHFGLRGLLASLDRDSMPVIGEIGLNGDVLLFNLVVSIAVGLLFGLVPALSTARRDLLGPLKDGAKSSAGRSHQRLRGALVIAEVGLALVVLAGALLFLQSFKRLTATSPGIVPENVLTVGLSLSTAVYSEDALKADFFDRLLERLEALPGVRSVATTMPLLGGWQTSVSAEGQEPPPPGEDVSTDITRVSPGYFETLGLTLLQGRTFTPADREDAPLVAVIDQTFGERFWPGENPVGKRLKLDGDPTSDDPWVEVVGVVNHVKNYGVDQDSRIEVYLPSRQSQFPFTTVLLKTAGDPLALEKQVAREVTALDSDQPIAQVRSLDSILAGSMVPQRLAAMLLAVFALLAVVLAAIGIYGVMAWSVGQRRHEIGVRMALGAARFDVLTLVVGQGLKLALAGVVLGLTVAFAAAPLLASQLYEIAPRDPRTLLALPLVLTAVALAACALPARRASRLEPVVALRHE